jgi:hypothetical protein
MNFSKRGSRDKYVKKNFVSDAFAEVLCVHVLRFRNQMSGENLCVPWLLISALNVHGSVPAPCAVARFSPETQRKLDKARRMSYFFRNLKHFWALDSAVYWLVRRGTQWHWYPRISITHQIHTEETRRFSYDDLQSLFRVFL